VTSSRLEITWQCPACEKNAGHFREAAQVAEHHSAVGNLAHVGRVAVRGQDPNTSVHPFMTSTPQARCRNTDATNIVSMHHRHRRPPPPRTFTSYPQSRVADLSRSPARQPSLPSLPIPQLLPPRRRHTCTGAALRRKRRCGPHLRPVRLPSRHARFQSEPPFVGTYVNFNVQPRWSRFFMATF
jgi:hypothetical protein